MDRTTKSAQSCPLLDQRQQRISHQERCQVGDLAAPPPTHGIPWHSSPAADADLDIELFEVLDLLRSAGVAQFVGAQPQACWRNALLGMLSHPLLADGCYVEGIAVFCEENGTHDTEDGAGNPTQPHLASATPTRFAYPVEHGWVELPDGRIIDPTVALLDHAATSASPGAPRDEPIQGKLQHRFGQSNQCHHAGSPVGHSMGAGGVVDGEIDGEAASQYTARAETPAETPAGPPTSHLRLPSGWVIPHRLAVIYVAGPRYAREALWSLCHEEDARPYLPFVARDHRGGFSDPTYHAAYQLAVRVVQAIS